MSITAVPSTLSLTDRRATRVLDNELGRLHGLETAYDPGTIRLLDALALSPEASCLEVAAGAGSIASWMRTKTAGHVVALDTDTVHLRRLPGIEVVEADIRSWQPARQFDLVHCRFLLDLLPYPVDAVARLAGMTAPGGYLVLEEFDDLTASLASGPPALVARHEQVLATKQAAFDAAGYNNHLGRHLPALVNATGAFRMRAAGHVAVRQGGSPETAPWCSYLENEQTRLAATGRIDRPDLHAYAQQLTDPSFVYFAPMLVSVVAEKL